MDAVGSQRSAWIRWIRSDAMGYHLVYKCIYTSCIQLWYLQTYWYKIDTVHTRAYFVCWQKIRLSQYITRANMVASAVARCALRIRVVPIWACLNVSLDDMILLFDFYYVYSHMLFDIIHLIAALCQRFNFQHLSNGRISITCKNNNFAVYLIAVYTMCTHSVTNKAKEIEIWSMFNIQYTRGTKFVLYVLCRFSNGLAVLNDKRRASYWPFCHLVYNLASPW